MLLTRQLEGRATASLPPATFTEGTEILIHRHSLTQSGSEVKGSPLEHDGTRNDTAVRELSTTVRTLSTAERPLGINAWPLGSGQRAGYHTGGLYRRTEGWYRRNHGSYRRARDTYLRSLGCTVVPQTRTVVA